MIKEYFDDFKGLFFEMGIPARLKRDAQTWNDVQVFCDRFQGHNLYTSVYGLKEPMNYQSAIIDKLFFEFDADEGEFDETLRAEAVKCLEWMDKHTDFKPQLFFSGRRGIHFVIHFQPVHLMNINQALQRMIDNIERLSGSKAICTGSRNGAAQMRRIPGSRHQGTGLFCIPLSPQELMTHPCTEIKELARRSRDTWPVPSLSKDLPRALEEIDHNIELAKLAFSLREKPVKLEMVKDCIAFQEVCSGVNYGARDHALVGLIYALRGQGKSKSDIEDYLIHEWLPKNPPVKYGDIDWVRYKVNYHYERFGNACNWFNKAKVPLCESCPTRKKIEALEAF